MLRSQEPARDALRRMLFGSPLSTRRDHACELKVAGGELNRALRGVQRAMLNDVNESRVSALQTQLEWERIVDMDDSYASIMAKRGALMYAGWTVPGVLAHWRGSDPTLVRTLEEFALPLVMPSFVRGMAQCPDSLIVLLDVLCDMWGGEEMLAH